MVFCACPFVCVHLHEDVEVRVYMCMYMKCRVWHWMSSSITLHYSVWQRSLTDLGAHWYSLAGLTENAQGSPISTHLYAPNTRVTDISCQLFCECLGFKHHSPLLTQQTLSHFAAVTHKYFWSVVELLSLETVGLGAGQLYFKAWRPFLDPMDDKWLSYTRKVSHFKMARHKKLLYYETHICRRLSPSRSQKAGLSPELLSALWKLQNLPGFLDSCHCLLF